MAEPSWQDLWDSYKASAQSARPTLTFNPGSVPDALAAGTASAASMILARVANRFLANFLDGSFGEDLIALAHDRGVEADPGSSAIGIITFTRSSAAAGSGTILHGYRVATEPDEDTGLTITVTTDEDVVFGPLDLTKSVAATITQIGKAGNVAQDTLIRKLDPIFDNSITVINADRFAGGEEAESEEDLRDRVRGFFLTQARGTVDALAFGARFAGARRVSVVVDDSGVVTIYVADEDGNSNAALVAAVAKEIEHWRAASDIVIVSPGVLVDIGIVLSLTVRTGTSLGALLDAVRQAVVSRVARLNPGETLFRDMIAAAARDVDKEAIQGVEVVSPVANIVPNANELLRTSTSGVTFQ